jgi:hypothetical protein
MAPFSYFFFFNTKGQTQGGPLFNYTQCSSRQTCTVASWVCLPHHSVCPLQTGAVIFVSVSPFPTLSTWLCPFMIIHTLGNQYSLGLFPVPGRGGEECWHPCPVRKTSATHPAPCSPGSLSLHHGLHWLWNEVQTGGFWVLIWGTATMGTHPSLAEWD